MGYKLAGYEVLGGVEIDRERSKIYVKNHNPKYEYLMGVQDFKNLDNDKLPEELFDLDILDGSPPCSSFSMAGSREKKWGKKKKFREGQAEQVLDDLFFDFIDVADKLKPKVVVAENVKGLIQGNARGYVKQIFKRFREAGYSCQLFLLNAAAMGVPQKRERTFFIANRIGADKIKLEFNEDVIPLKEAFKNMETGSYIKLPPSLVKEFGRLKVGDKGKYFSCSIASPSLPSSTITSKVCISAGSVLHWEGRNFSSNEVLQISSFPTDYAFNKVETGYVCGMSVPPFMMQRVADQIYRQWLFPYYERI
jgi:DNA (cytosine-5)-methyltransferase 1